MCLHVLDMDLAFLTVYFEGKEDFALATNRVSFQKWSFLLLLEFCMFFFTVLGLLFFRC